MGQWTSGTLRPKPLHQGGLEVGRGQGGRHPVDMAENVYDEQLAHSLISAPTMTPKLPWAVICGLLPRPQNPPRHCLWARAFCFVPELCHMPRALDEEGIGLPDVVTRCWLRLVLCEGAQCRRKRAVPPLGQRPVCSRKLGFGSSLLKKLFQLTKTRLFPVFGVGPWVGFGVFYDRFVSAAWRAVVGPIVKSAPLEIFNFCVMASTPDPESGNCGSNPRKV